MKRQHLAIERPIRMVPAGAAHLQTPLLQQRGASVGMHAVVAHGIM